MRVVAQRAASARVEVNGEIVGAIGPGLLVLVGFEESDGEEDLAWMSCKLSRLRLRRRERGDEPQRRRFRG